MKTYLIILLLVQGILVHAQHSSTELHRQIALAVFQSFNEHDCEKMTSYYHGEVIIQDPGEPDVVKGTSGMVEKFAGYAAYVPDIQDSIVHLYVMDNHVVVEFIS